MLRSNKISASKYLKPFIVSSVVIFFSATIGLSLISHTPQKYVDLIIEVNAYYQDLNKSGEYYFIMSVIVVLSLYIAYYFYKLYPTSQKQSISSSNISRQYYYSNEIILFFLLPVITYFILTGIISLYFILAVIIILACVFCFKENKYLIHFMVTTYFFLLAFVQFSYMFTYNGEYLPIINQNVFIIVILLIVIIFNTQKFRKYTDKITLYSQIFIPFSLLTYIVDNYREVDGTITTIKYTDNYYIFIILVILVLVVAAIFQLYDSIKKGKRPTIFLSTIITIFVLSAIDIAPALYFNGDFHHNAETFIPFMQVWEFDKIIYKDYILASGLFPMFFGFIQYVMLLSTDAIDFHQANTVMRIIFGTITIVLIYRRTGYEFALIFSLLFTFSSYTRIYLLLPCMLILIDRSVLKNPLVWVSTTALSCLILGLYYPLYGGALTLGVLPFFMVQCYTIFNKFKKYKSWFSITLLVFTIAIILVSLPLLLRILHHIILFSGQTRLADGIAIFDHVPPSRLFRYISLENFRQMLYYFIVIFIVTIPVLLFVSIFTLYMRYDKNSLIIKFSNPSFFVYSAGIIMLPIIYTYGLMRIDYGDTGFRALVPVFAILCGFLAPFVYSDGKKIFTTKGRFIIISIIISITALYGNKQVYAKLIKPYYYVLGGYTRIPEDIASNRVGDGYFDKSAVDSFRAFQNAFNSEKLKDYLIFGFPPAQLSYHLGNLEASVTGTGYILRSTDVQEHILDIIEKDIPTKGMPIFGIVDFVGQFKIYLWMMKNGYMQAENGLYMTKKQSIDIYGQDDLKPLSRHIALSYVASALGKSIKHLGNILEETTIEYNVVNNKLSFSEEEKGDNIDFIALKIKSPDLVREDKTRDFFIKSDWGKHRTVTLDWKNKTQNYSNPKITFFYGDGVFLIPVFMSPDWMQSMVNEILFKCNTPNGTIENLEISDIKFYKLRGKYE